MLNWREKNEIVVHNDIMLYFVALCELMKLFKMVVFVISLFHKRVILFLRHFKVQL